MSEGVQGARGPARETRSSLLDRFLRLFSDVRAGEGSTAALMTLNLFLLLVAYYIIKTVREPLILMTGGAEGKSYATATQAAVLMLAVPLYGAFAKKVTANKLIRGVTVFFIVCIELFYVAAWLEVPYLGFIFYVWVGIFSLAMVAQFWSYANDLYDRDQGERLFPVLGIGGTAGSLVGALIAKILFDFDFGAYNLLQVAAALLVAHLFLYAVVSKRPLAPGSVDSATQKLSGAGGFTLILERKYLRMLALLLLLLNLVNTTGEFILASYVVELSKEAATAALAADPGLVVDDFKEAWIGSFYAGFFLYVNIAGVLLQAFVVSRIVKYTGLAGVLLMLPVVSLGAYTLVALGVSFSIFQWAKSAENATDYSVMNTARALLWLPTTRDEKYKAKLAIDTFVVRVGDMLSGGLVFVGTEYLAFEATDFARTNVVIAVVWLGLAWLLYREYKKLAAEGAAAA